MPDQDTESVAPTGCENCREQHLKCDREIPTCGRCQNHGRECRRGFKFRGARQSFAQNQPWMRMPKKLKYVDETQLASQGSGDQDIPRGEDIEDTSSDTECEEGNNRVVTYSNFQDSREPQGLLNVAQPASPSDRFIVHEDLIEGRGSLLHSVNPPAVSHLEFSNQSQNSLRPQIYLDKSVWPLSNPDEALLFRHFVQKLSIWLDLCDPRQSFETIAPQRAGTCPILLNAIFALAARHLSHTSDFDPWASNRYHERCLKYLIPMLDHAVTVSDENLFAATIILRVLEEMEVRTMGWDTHGHLLGIHAFVHGRDRYLAPNSLTAACFWVGIRQEIYSAIMNHEPVRIKLNHAIVDRSFEATDDFGWANRAVVLCANVLNFCFGDETASTTSRWNELDQGRRTWVAAVPDSFTPIFFRERTGSDAFPEIWHQAGCHVMGIQHHILAELFLASFDPKLPRIGTRRQEADKRVNQRIRDLVRQICGIGLSNQWAPPAMFTACMAISAFGDRFHVRSDQEAFLQVLKKTEHDHARPTEAVQQQMMKSWEWNTSETSAK